MLVPDGGAVASKELEKKGIYTSSEELMFEINRLFTFRCTGYLSNSTL